MKLFPILSAFFFMGFGVCASAQEDPARLFAYTDASPFDIEQVGGDLFYSEVELRFGKGAVLPIEILTDREKSLRLFSADTSLLPDEFDALTCDRTASFVVTRSEVDLKSAADMELTLHLGVYFLSDRPVADDLTVIPDDLICGAQVYLKYSIQDEDTYREMLSLSGPDTAAELSSTDRGAWYVNETNDPLTDNKTVVAILTAESAVGASYDKPALIARCANNKTEAYLNWHDYLGRGPSDVTTRLDSDRATTTRWSHSTDDTATFASSPIALLKSMLDHDELIAQATPYRSAPITATFDLAGMRAALTPLAEACHWSLE